jgi:hypothetical protein
MAEKRWEEMAEKPKELIPFLDLLQEPEPVEWMAEKWVARKDIILLGGRAGSGKSTTAVDLAISMSGARNGSGDGTWLGNKVTECPVIYLDEEAGDSEIIRQFRRQGCVQPKNLHVASMQRLRLSDPASLDKIEHEVKEKQPGLLVLDTVSHFFLGVDENNAGEVTRLFVPLFHLRDTYGVAILLLHHIKKPPQNNQQPDMMDQIRGSTAFTTQPSAVWGAIPNLLGNYIDLISTKRRGAGKHSMRISYTQSVDGGVKLSSLGEPERVETQLDNCSRFIVNSMQIDDRECWRTSEIIAHGEKNGHSERTVQSCITHLAAVGAITKLRKGYYCVTQRVSTEDVLDF